MAISKRLVVGVLTIVSAATGVTCWMAVRPIIQAENTVRTRLKDPDSARFAGVSLNEKTGSICGWVNAKNSWGGYTGMTEFVLIVPTGEFVLRPATSGQSDVESNLKDVRDALEFLRRAENECVLATAALPWLQRLGLLLWS